jgi:hypothetical protein
MGPKGSGPPFKSIGLYHIICKTYVASFGYEAERHVCFTSQAMDFSSCKEWQQRQGYRCSASDKDIDKLRYSASELLGAYSLIPIFCRYGDGKEHHRFN